MGVDTDDYYSLGHIDRPGKKPSLHSRLQNGKQLYLHCFIYLTLRINTILLKCLRQFHSICVAFILIGWESKLEMCYLYFSVYNH